MLVAPPLRAKQQNAVTMHAMTVQNHVLAFNLQLLVEKLVNHTTLPSGRPVTRLWEIV